MNPYDNDEKIIHVGTPGIFHKMADAFARRTVCGRDMSDARATEHDLSDYQPCIVCYPPEEGA
ncbi:MAG: hypothetical protein WC565_03135 [Parcubacteria group bacterium]